MLLASTRSLLSPCGALTASHAPAAFQALQAFSSLSSAGLPQQLPHKGGDEGRGAPVLPLGLALRQSTTGAFTTKMPWQSPPLPFSVRHATTVPEARPDDHEGKRTFGLPQKTFDEGYVAPHPGIAKDVLANAPKDVKESYMEHMIWYDKAYLESVHPVHLPPKNMADKVGLATVRFMRSCFDKATGYGPNMTEAKWLQRTIFLETVAGVPGMVAGMLRHLRSLRAFRTDKGWIHCLLEEAENERMHLLTFLQMRQPGPLFRFFVIGAQGVFFNLYFIVYLLWPKVCHSFVGYLEEEAVRTYTHLISDIDNDKVWKNKPAPKIAKEYWCLPEDATMRDLILAVRADEACHSHVNHTLKTLGADDPNPFVMGKSQAP